MLLPAFSIYAAQPARCGTKQPSDAEVAAIEQAVAKGKKGKTSAVIDVWIQSAGRRVSLVETRVSQV